MVMALGHITYQACVMPTVETGGKLDMYVLLLCYPLRNPRAQIDRQTNEISARHVVESDCFLTDS